MTLFRMDDGTCGTDDVSGQRLFFRFGTGGMARFSLGEYLPLVSGVVGVLSSFMVF
jgi:hypothetical protein